MKKLMLLVPLALCAVPFFADSLSAASGEEVYAKRCAVCHDQVNERIPPRAALQKLPASRIVRALNAGVMMAVGFTLSHEDRIAVASYLGTTATESGPSPASFCSDRTVKLADNPKASWNGWSPRPDNARFQPGDVAHLSVDQVRSLKLKWAFGFDGDAIAFAPPTVIDGELFVGSAAGLVHAMRADSGCLQWVFQADGPVRSSIVAVPFGNGHALLFGDMLGWFYAVQAETGKLVWKTRVDTHDSTRLTGGPAAYEGTVYVPVSSWEETRAGDKEYACCTFRGSVVALRIKDGMQLWKTWMTDPPAERGKNARGIPIFGPSGVAVWSRPTIDAQRKLLYVGTGDNYSPPTTELSDAVLALDMATGRIVWSRQLTAKDFYNGSCGTDPSCGPDFDFGSSPITVRAPNGHRMAANCCWRGKNRASSGRSIPRSKARSCGRRALAKAAPMAACSGAWPPMGSASSPPSPTSSARRRRIQPTRAARLSIPKSAAGSPPCAWPTATRSGTSRPSLAQKTRPPAAAPPSPAP